MDLLPYPRGNLVLVGDLMRSVSLLSYNAEQGTLEHRAADYSSGWTTAVEVRACVLEDVLQGCTKRETRLRCR